MGAMRADAAKERMATADTADRNARQMDDILSRSLRAFYLKAFQYLRNDADAEDAVQDALLLALQHLDQFKGQAQLSTWLTSIVINSSLMHLRQRARHVHVSLDERSGRDDSTTLGDRLSSCAPSPEDVCRRSEFREHLARLLPALSPPLRKAFQLRDLDGLTTAEAAAVLGVAHGTVKAQIARARARLRKSLGRDLRKGRRTSLVRMAD